MTVAVRMGTKVAGGGRVAMGMDQIGAEQQRAIVQEF